MHLFLKITFEGVSHTGVFTNIDSDNYNSQKTSKKLKLPELFFTELP